MSANFLRVKRDILRDIKESSCHSQSSWADILLRHTKYCITKEDQQSLYNYILNPEDTRDFVNPTYEDIPLVDSVNINRFEKMLVSNPEDEKEQKTEIALENEIYTKGNTTFVITKPITLTEYMLKQPQESQDC